MDFKGFEETTIRQVNQRNIEHDDACQKIIIGMREIEKFLSRFEFLSFGRDFAFCRNHTFSLQMVLIACELTAGSIISCCESGCLADANSLLRKYRDDLFFYLYIVVYSKSNQMEIKTAKLKQMEDNIEKWINNNLCDLSIGTVMQAIGQSPLAKDAVTKYHLQSYFKTIGEKLNNYVHSNGVNYYNRNVNTYTGNSLQVQMQELLNDLRFLTITFVFLLTICFPLSIMATDYVDYLEFNEMPPDGSQYWVAPFVNEFFNQNLDLIDKGCIDYLRENTLMEFD